MSSTSGMVRGWLWAKLFQKIKFMNDLTPSRWLPVALLIGSNVFMTFAWYGNLKFKNKPRAFVK